MRGKQTKRIAAMGLLFALAAALSYLESLVPGIPIPGIKLGLSNIVTMYCLFFAGAVPALILAALKAALVLITRGAVAAALSLAGGLLAVAAMVLARRLKASDGAASVAGAVAHNAGQTAAACLILRSWTALYYLPILLISGIIMGTVTAFILRFVMPALKKLNFID
jgi:heptaprenyl diphosphate synthase